MTLTGSIRIPAAALLAVFSLLALSPRTPAQSADPGDRAILVRPSKLKSQPSDGAETRASLTLGQRVQLNGFRGRWAHVTAADSAEGWIPAANVRLNQDRATSGGAVTGFLRRITGAVNKAPAPSEGSAHLGIRGLEPGDVANARPNPAELRELDSYRATRTMAERHARDEQLASRSMPYRDPSETTRRSTTGLPESSDRN